MRPCALVGTLASRRVVAALPASRAFAGPSRVRVERYAASSARSPERPRRRGVRNHAHGGLCRVVSRMFGMGAAKLEVFHPVVQPVAVDMVNDFTSEKRAPKMQFHRHPVFQNTPTLSDAARKLVPVRRDDERVALGGNEPSPLPPRGSRAANALGCRCARLWRGRIPWRPLAVRHELPADIGLTGIATGPGAGLSFPNGIRSAHDAEGHERSDVDDILTRSLWCDNA